MTHSPYKRPPIIEAAIEIRFSTEIDESVFKKLTSRYETNYPELKPIESHKVDININGVDTETNTTVQTDYRFYSKDMSQIILLKSSSFLLSQLAPYESWEALISRFDRDWRLFKRFAGHNPIARIGVRFINRIDIPKSDSLIHEDEYLNIYPKHPKNLDPLLSYAIHSQTELSNINSILTLNSAVVPSPLPKHISIVIDQDISREVEPPQNTEDIINFLNEVRTEKNSVFESCITDKARELFNR